MLDKNDCLEHTKSVNADQRIKNIRHAMRHYFNNLSKTVARLTTYTTVTISMKTKLKST